MTGMNIMILEYVYKLYNDLKQIEMFSENVDGGAS